ncbi:glycosyltransferase [Longimicrobium sp.]|uniref:glycosyltransferase family 2 protein n=1 Tax=Longimicrobium sp. TaxID=2029185 RepID=UPI002ED986F5
MPSGAGVSGAVQFNGLLVVVPTRNRADLAENAVRSLLGEHGSAGVRIVVSDNSTDAAAAERLRAFCETTGSGTLHYLRPPVPLAMAAHWDWAMQTVLHTWPENHVAYLTDRMVFREGEVRAVMELARRYPDRVVAYLHDHLAGYAPPFRVEQVPWTGRAYEVYAADLLALAARGVLSAPGLPKMLNCVVPRTVLDRLRARFGKFFDSVAPDFNFCYRCLAEVESVVHYDSAAVVHYALDRSNGASLSRGVRTRDHADFLASVGGSLAPSAPVPELRTVGNVIFHEYCRTRAETGSRRLPELDRERYLDYLGREIELVEDPAERRHMRALLEANGWRASVPKREPFRAARLRKLLSPRLVLRRLSMAAAWMLREPWARPFWTFLAGRTRIRIPADARFTFGSMDEALRFATRFRTSPARDDDHLRLPGLRIYELRH